MLIFYIFFIFLFFFFFLDLFFFFFFFFQAEDGIRDLDVTGVQTCALPISRSGRRGRRRDAPRRPRSHRSPADRGAPRSPTPAGVRDQAPHGQRGRGTAGPA